MSEAVTEFYGLMLEGRPLSANDERATAFKRSRGPIMLTLRLRALWAMAGQSLGEYACKRLRRKQTV